MLNGSPYSFRMEQTSYKSQYLIYEEPGHVLQVYLELSGVPEFDWVGSEMDLNAWSSPAGESISPEKRQEILNRLASWCRAKRARIDLSPPISMAEIYEDDRRKGCTVVQNPDGSTTITPPKRRSWFHRLFGKG